MEGAVFNILSLQTAPLFTRGFPPYSFSKNLILLIKIKKEQ